MIGSKDDFVVRGNFGTVTACSLPPWTPSHIVDLMNEKLGLMLRQDLVTFMALDNANTRLRGHHINTSTSSEAISVDSAEGLGGLVPQFLFA